MVTSVNVVLWGAGHAETLFRDLPPFTSSLSHDLESTWVICVASISSLWVVNGTIPLSCVDQDLQLDGTNSALSGNMFSQYPVE